MLKQHQVGIVFGLFSRAVCVARLTYRSIPLLALFVLAFAPWPRAKFSIDASASTSGFVQFLHAAQRGGAAFPFRPVAPDSSAAHSSRSSVARAEPGPLSRFGDRWRESHGLHSSWLPLGQRLRRDSSDPQARSAVAAADASRLFDWWHGISLTNAIAALQGIDVDGGSVDADATEGDSERSADDDPNDSDDIDAPGGTLADAPRQGRASGDAAPGAPNDSRGDAAAGTARAAPDARAEGSSWTPLKLSREQRNIARFVAKTYHVDMDDVQRFVAHAFRAAHEFHLDPYLVLAVMSVESSFNAKARSTAGAQGLMQVLTRVHAEKFAPFGGARAALDPMVNITVGSRILKEYLVREGSVEGALKSYVGAAMLPHDSGYSTKVLDERERMAAAAEGRPVPARSVMRATRKIAMAQPSSGEAETARAAPAEREAPVREAALLPRDDAPAVAEASPGSQAQATKPMQSMQTATAQATQAATTQARAVQAQASTRTTSSPAAQPASPANEQADETSAAAPAVETRAPMQASAQQTQPVVEAPVGESARDAHVVRKSPAYATDTRSLQSQFEL